MLLASLSGEYGIDDLGSGRGVWKYKERDYGEEQRIVESVCQGDAN
jgi:hypothetical protein